MTKSSRIVLTLSLVTSCVATVALSLTSVAGATSVVGSRHSSLSSYLAQHAIRSGGARHEHVANAVAWTPHSINTPSGGMNAVSCVSASFCIAVDNGGSATAFDGTVWSTPVAIDATNSLDAISCVSTTFCAATDADGNYIFYNSGVWGTPTPFNPAHPTTLVATSISCPTATYCLALGATFSGSNSTPTAMFWDNATWFSATTGIVADVFSSVSCVSRSFCMGVSYQGQFVKYGAPTISGGTEHVTASSAASIDAADLVSGITAVSCSTSTFCAAGDDFGDLLVYSSPTWHLTGFVFSYASTTFVSCSKIASGDVSGNNCIAMDDAGETARLNGLGWTNADSVNPNANVSGLSCFNDANCVGVDYDGFAVALTEVLASSSLTSQLLTQQIFDQPNNITTSSCASASDCLAGDAGGNVYVFNGTSWTFNYHLPGNVPFGVKAISCNEVTATMSCMILDYFGNQFWYQNGAWSQPLAGANATSTVAAASCSAVPNCLVLDQNFVAARFTSFTDDTTTTLPSGDLANASPVAASCVATLSRCVVVDSDGYAYISPSGTTWTKTSLFISDPSNEIATAISCPTATFCAATDDGGNVYLLNNSSWGHAVSVSSTAFTGISCVSSYRCVAVDRSGDAYLYDGTSWTVSAQVASTGDSLNAISCETALSCLATDSNNSFTLSSTPSATTTSLVAIAAAQRTASHLVVTVKVTGASSPNGVVTVTRASTSCDAHLTLIAGTKSSQGSCLLPSPDLIGTVHLSAQYHGSFNFLGSSATGVSQVLSEESVTTLKISSGSVQLGHEQTIHFTAGVAPQHPGIVATGSVTIEAGSVHLCTFNLVKGSGSCSPKASALSRGSHQIVALYNGTKILLTSTSSSRTLSVK